MTRRVKRALILAAALMASSCAGVDPAPDPAATAASGSEEKLLQAGEKALADRRYGDAQRYFQRTLEIHRDHSKARLGLAETYLGAGEFEKAREAFVALSQVPEVRLAGLQGLALVQLRAGETEKAKQALLAITAQDGSLWRAWNGLAASYGAEHEWAKAVEAYQQALRTSPEPAVIHNNWGVSLMAQGAYPEAEAQFTRALKVKTGLQTARNNLRLVLAFQGRYAEALSGVDSAELPPTLNNVGYAALLRGDLATAEAYFIRALEASPAFYAPAAKNLQLLGSMKEIQASARSGRSS